MIEKLLEYQTVDAELKNIENELKKSEEFKKYAQAVKFLKTVTESKSQIEAKASSLLTGLGALEKKLQKLDEDKSEFSALNDVEDEATLAFLKKKSQELSNQYAVLEQEIEKLAKEMTELATSYKKLMSNTKLMLEQQDEFKKKYEDLLKAKESEKVAIKKKLTAIEKDIPSEYMDKYKEKRKDPKFPIVYELKDRHCTACGTELSQLELSRLKNEKIIECENCRRLIFVKE